MEVPWDRPAWIQVLDDRVGLDKETLKFSYLVVTREGRVRDGSARVVSRLHREKGKVWAWLCGAGEPLVRAELLRRDLSDANRGFRHARRGDVLEISEFAPAERVRLSAQTLARKNRV